MIFEINCLETTIPAVHFIKYSAKFWPNENCNSAIGCLEDCLRKSDNRGDILVTKNFTNRQTEVPHFGKSLGYTANLSLLPKLGTLQTFWVCHYYPDWVCCNLFTKTEEAGVNGLWTELKIYFSTLAARLQRRRWSLWKVSESVLKY